MNKIPVVIMAGGLGKRIQSVDSTVPKPLIKVDNKPILQWEIECLVNQGYTSIILTVAHMGEKIIEFFGDGSDFGCSISYFVEEKPLGNAGALFKLLKSGRLEPSSDFMLLNADSLFDIDFDRFYQFHLDHGALVSLFVHPNNHPYDSGLILKDETERVVSWLTKEDARPEWYSNSVNAGLHIINTRVLSSLLEKGKINADMIGTEDEFGRIVKVDLDRQILKPNCSADGKIYAYRSPEYVKDMGTPERLKQVSEDLVSGLVCSKNLKKPQKAVFLDRDGVINEYRGFLRDIDDFVLLEDVAEAIRIINTSGYLAIVITNQPVIARGEVTLEELSRIHRKMETLLGSDGAYIDDIYICPHHPDSGYEGEIKALKIDCDCRKPKPGLLYQAAADYNICLEDSWMIGDSWRDVEAGHSAGCKTALLVGEGTEGAGMDPGDVIRGNDTGCNPDMVEFNLLKAVQKIIL